MRKFILLFVMVFITACSGATTSGSRTKPLSPVTTGLVDIQLPPTDGALVESALAALTPADKDFVVLHTTRFVPGAKTMADLASGTTIISSAHMYMGNIRLGAVLVHEACHHWQWFSGRVASGTSAEHECRTMQAKAQTRARLKIASPAATA